MYLEYVMQQDALSGVVLKCIMRDAHVRQLTHDRGNKGRDFLRLTRSSSVDQLRGRHVRTGVRQLYLLDSWIRLVEDTSAILVGTLEPLVTWTSCIVGFLDQLGYIMCVS